MVGRSRSPGHETPQKSIDRPVSRPVRTQLMKLVLTMSWGVWIHDKGVGGPETTGNNEETIMWLLLPLKTTPCVVVRKGTNTLGWPNKRVEVLVTHKGRSEVPDANDTAVDIRGRNKLWLQFFSDVSWPPSRYIYVEGPTGEGVAIVKGRLNDTGFELIGKDNTTGGEESRQDESVCVLPLRL